MYIYATVLKFIPSLYIYKLKFINILFFPAIFSHIPPWAILFASIHIDILTKASTLLLLIKEFGRLYMFQSQLIKEYYKIQFTHVY